MKFLIEEVVCEHSFITFGLNSRVEFFCLNFNLIDTYYVLTLILCFL